MDYSSRDEAMFKFCDGRYFIAVDFDGCLAKTNFPKIIEPNEMVIAQLHRRIVDITSCGWDVYTILWTCREDLGKGKRYLSDAIKFCEEHGIPIDFVNENPLMNFGRPEKVRKIFANEYWDDCAVVAK